MDVYIIISLAFVFLALVELALVLMATKMLEISMKKSKSLRPSSNNSSNYQFQEPETITGSHNVTSIHIDCQRSQEWEQRQAPFQNNEKEEENTYRPERTTIVQSIFMELSITNKLDFLAFIFFNLVYLAFNVIYFLKLLNKSY